MEATCDAPWFERALQEHHHELWIGDAAESFQLVPTLAQAGIQQEFWNCD
jgi:hypothetical protein